MPSNLPERALDTSPEHPWPVRMLSLKITDYVQRLAPVWVEGEVVQLNRRDRTAYLVLRDPEADMSLSATISTNALDALAADLSPGARVVLHAKPTFWAKRGTLQLEGRSIRHVGVGDLLARIDVLRRRLAAEGIFDAGRKRALPFLPHQVGLITGRDSAAQRDVVDNARVRWPRVRFEVRQVAVQGPHAVGEIVTALAALDGRVDVIVIARGGGAVEELLAFSNETLVRAVAACSTPVVSAIGHESDTPLLDFVADVRASTPTDAAKRVVPDTSRELSLLKGAVMRMRGALERRLGHERHRLDSASSRPVMAHRAAFVTAHRDHIGALRRRGVSGQRVRLATESAGLRHLRRRALGLSPQATLDRGYALVTTQDDHLVTDPAQVLVSDSLHVQVAKGELVVTVAHPAGR